MVVFITVLHIVLCLFLIVVVLLQTGKGADMGAAFGGASQTVFGATGAMTLLHKVTTVTAVLFMLTSLGLAYHSAREQAGGSGLDEDIFDKEKRRAEQEAAEEQGDGAREQAGQESGDEAGVAPGDEAGVAPGDEAGDEAGVAPGDEAGDEAGVAPGDEADDEAGVAPGDEAEGESGGNGAEGAAPPDAAE